MTIYIYGDSHASFSLRNLENSINRFHPSITMFRIGRDNVIINLSKSDISKDNTYIFVYGEVDCRCHIGRQVALGRDEDEVINSLVDSYINAIKHNITEYLKILVIGVIPPVCRKEYELRNGPITHEFPLVGSDSDRIRYTNKVNRVLEEKCIENKFIYVYPYVDYNRTDGCLKWELSDGVCHIRNNDTILQIVRSHT